MSGATRLRGGPAMLALLAAMPARAQTIAPSAGVPTTAPAVPPASPGTTTTSTPSAPPAADAPTTDVVVTAERPSVRTSIDRKSYSLAKDIQATTGSAADVLRDVPSVTVDVDGNPSLRGDANVQILIDGRPAPQFNTADRGAALQQLGADTIDRIEVLTNPPATFKSDGSAGVINIITKKKAGGSGASAQASVGSSGRFNLSGTGDTRVGALLLHGTLTLRRDLRTRIATDDRRETDPASGAFIDASSQRTSTTNDRLSKIATLGADYDLGARDHLSAEGTYNVRTESDADDERNTSLAADGSPDGSADRIQRGHGRETISSALARYKHDIGGGGDGLTLSAQRSETSETQHFHYRPIDPATEDLPAFDDQKLYSDEVTRELTAEYVRTLPGSAKLILGYDLQRDDDTYDDLRATRVAGGSAPVIDPNFTNRFVYGQTVHAAYASYERTFGSLTVLPGLRLEETYIDTDQVTGGQRGESSYFRAFPNLHLSERVGEHQTLTFSYGQRINRPDARDLNPIPEQRDAFTIDQGNAALRPEDIRSAELGWSYDRGATSRSVTLYVRDTRNRITSVSIPDGPVLIDTERNVGDSLAGGVEMAAAGKLVRSLSYNLSGNLFYNTIDASNLGFSSNHATFSYEAKAALDWRATRADTLQANIGAVGRRLSAQGYRLGSVGVDLGARHQLRRNLALTATLSDAFASRHDGTEINVAGLDERTRRQLTGRIVFLGLSWSRAGTKAKESFDYEK